MSRCVFAIRDLNLQPSVSTYNSVLKACVRGKNYSRALTTMNDLRVSGKRPEQESWDLLVEACAVCGRWECAVEVVRDMFAEEVREMQHAAYEMKPRLRWERKFLPGGVPPPLRSTSFYWSKPTVMCLFFRFSYHRLRHSNAEHSKRPTPSATPQQTPLYLSWTTWNAPQREATSRSSLAKSSMNELADDSRDEFTRSLWQTVAIIQLYNSSTAVMYAIQ